MNEALEIRLERLRSAVLQTQPCTLDGTARSVLFFAVTDGAGRARVFSAGGADPHAAWEAGVAKLRAQDGVVRWLRVDWITAAERTSWNALRERLLRTKRNYLRLGISLDEAFEHAFLETELNANAMLYGGPGIPTAIVNEKNFALYAAQRHNIDGIDFGDDTAIWLFSTHGLFIGDDLIPRHLDGQGRNAGRRTIERLDPDALRAIIGAGSTYLASQVQEDGRFHYGWHPCFDRPIPSYNSLRHASSVYAMLEAWDVTRDDALRLAIERALAHLTNILIEPMTLPDGTGAAFLIDPGAEIKLGGNALSILALVKHAELMETDTYRPLCDLLAAGILHMQDPQTGRFVHVLSYPSLAVKQDFRIIYYEGEAAFGLMRLFALTGDRRWLDAVERAFTHFIAAGHWKAHDHWLSYAVNELTRDRLEEAYFRFGLDNVRDHLDFVLDRITTFPTLLELMMAAERMVARLRGDPANRHLLDGIDLGKFYRALHVRAHYLLNGHFWPELAMFFANPARILGSFFIRHHAFRIRIDDVEHYLSGLIAYRRYLLERPADHEDVPAPSMAETGWTADAVVRATGGRWISPPPDGWSATGLCIAASTMLPGEMVVARVEGDTCGAPVARMDALPHRPAAILTTAPEQVVSQGLPVLAIADAGDAVLALGQYARAQLSGKVIGVTGSAGKTTLVAMISHVLAHWGRVGGTRHNANLPLGIAWNLASIPWDTPYSVLELAIGRMAQNSKLTRPDVAIFTNILPAHLEFHRDLATIARRKSAIFEGMASGGIAVINRDMEQYHIVRAAALAHGLRIVDYGRSAGADFGLLHYGASQGLVTARTPDGQIDYTIDAPGEHMALNSIAALAALSALGLDSQAVANAFCGFVPLAGRGQEVSLSLDGQRLVLIDEAYNANPGSMEQALKLLGDRPAARRVAVLGEMLELGPGAQTYHTNLAPLIEAHHVEQVHAIGRLYADFWHALAPERRGVWADTPDQLKLRLRAFLCEGDAVLFKGSHGSGVHTLVAWLKQAAKAVGPLSADAELNRNGWFKSLKR
jgi:UDP-N-acetylmuramoyl-tripeptide--D-alanyl-D-alanine ligase